MLVMDLEKLVDAILNKEPIFYISNNIEEIKKEQEVLKSNLDKLYVDGTIDESYYYSATKLIDDTYNSQIAKLNNDLEATQLRFGMAYIRDLTGSYPSIYNNIRGNLGENPHDVQLKINYKSTDEINSEREQAINLLYEQYTSGRINDKELQEKENKINLVYDNLIQSLPNKQSRKM